MNRHYKWIIMAVMAFVVDRALTAQTDYRPTLTELVNRQRPDPVFQSRSRELVPETLEQMVPKADLIVYGSVKRSSLPLRRQEGSLY